jgi:hypothetical protein
LRDKQIIIYGDQLWHEQATPQARECHRKGSAVLDSARAEKELYLRAQAFHRAGKILVNVLERKTSYRLTADVIPVVVLYHKAAELYLKAIILNHGRNFLTERPVLARFYGPRSLRVLLAMACQIFETAGRDRFRTDFVDGLSDFRRVIGKLESFYLAIRTLRRNDDQETIAITLPEFARQMDAVLNTLDATVNG